MKNNYKYKRKIAIDQVNQRHTFCHTQLQVVSIIKNRMNLLSSFFFLFPKPTNANHYISYMIQLEEPNNHRKQLWQKGSKC